jgi:hypothetical protein
MQVIQSIGRRELGFAKMALSSHDLDDNFGLHMVVCKSHEVGECRIWVVRIQS